MRRVEQRGFFHDEPPEGGRTRSAYFHHVRPNGLTLAASGLRASGRWQTIAAMGQALVKKIMTRSLARAGMAEMNNSPRRSRQRASHY